MLTRISFLFLFIFFGFQTVFAQTPEVIVGWNMQGVSGNTPSAQAQFMVQGINTTESGLLTRGSGLVPQSLSNCFRASNWSLSPDPKDAILDSTFFEFTISPAPGYILNITEVNMTIRQTQTGPQFYELVSSTDNFQTEVFHGTVGNLPSSASTPVFFQSNPLSNVNSQVRFRLYGFAASSSAGRSQIQNDAASTNAPYDLAIKGYLDQDSTVVILCPSANFSGPGSICLGEPVSFNDQSTTPQGTNIINYMWSFGDGNNSTGQNPTHTFFQPGTFDVKLVVTNDDFCNDTIVNQVTVGSQLNVVFDPIPSTFCENDAEINLTADPPGGVFSVQLRKTQEPKFQEDQDPRK
ncbi:MAG: PKD domain-containing protein [Chitinophagaceae bacterium]|nr:MAG: PKD domain-containing protein [Chitinophagaceae bacterium]